MARARYYGGRATQRLSWQVSKVLNHKGYHAEAAKLTVYHADGTSREIGQAAKPPTSDESRLSRLARGLFILTSRSTNMTTLVSPLFWNMKIKIAILTLATFAALC